MYTISSTSRPPRHLAGDDRGRLPLAPGLLRIDPQAPQLPNLPLGRRLRVHTLGIPAVVGVHDATTRLTNLFYGTDFTDIIGAKFYRTESFRALRPTNLTGIGFDWEVISKLCKYGCRVREVPVRYTPRTKGKRKIHAYDIIPAIATICRWRLFG